MLHPSLLCCSTQPDDKVVSRLPFTTLTRLYDPAAALICDTIRTTKGCQSTGAIKHYTCGLPTASTVHCKRLPFALSTYRAGISMAQGARRNCRRPSAAYCAMARVPSQRAEGSTAPGPSLSTCARTYPHICPFRASVRATHASSPPPVAIRPPVLVSST
jgi:hypothetical protein